MLTLMQLALNQCSDTPYRRNVYAAGLLSPAPHAALFSGVTVRTTHGVDSIALSISEIERIICIIVEQHTRSGAYPSWRQRGSLKSGIYPTAHTQ